MSTALAVCARVDCPSVNLQCCVLQFVLTVLLFQWLINLRINIVLIVRWLLNCELFFFFYVCQPDTDIWLFMAMFFVWKPDIRFGLLKNVQKTLYLNKWVGQLLALFIITVVCFYAVTIACCSRGQRAQYFYFQIAVDNGFGGVYGQQKADWLVDVVQQYFHDNGK